MSYDCARNLRRRPTSSPAAVDLVLYTTGGNDAGFSAMVQNCFVVGLRTASGCQAKVEAARAELPQIADRLLAGVAGVAAPMACATMPGWCSSATPTSRSTTASA